MRGIHLDCAASGRASEATQNAIADHLRAEARIGAYVAEDQAAPVISRLREDVARLLGVATDGVAFVESATAAFRSLVQAWPLKSGCEVLVAPSEWGPNLAAIDEAGLHPAFAEVDPAGCIDLDALRRRVEADPPGLVHITQVAAHRGLVQPVTEIAAVCREAGVPLWVDAAQAVGHVATASGADAVYGTGRKWLCGPRGVAFLGIAEGWWDRLHVRHGVLAPSDEPTVRALETNDANIVGRVGLASAVREFLEDGPDAIYARLAEVGAATRDALADLPSWVVEPATGTAITALRPTAGQYVALVRGRLQQEYGILTTASMPVRAPHEMTESTLRISPHVDCSPEQREALRAALYTEG